MITITKVGHTGRAFRIERDGNVQIVRTRSSRRYLVVSIGGYVWKRTDNLKTARAEVARGAAGRLFILDTLAVNADGQATI